mmetsp:Transcript_21806/g.60576  ORF Transcript_21806/g.60576 Transcript_21806/m.60576 type:complete len:339 (+) Transcript_21806:1013-2029(+)
MPQGRSGPVPHPPRRGARGQPPQARGGTPGGIRRNLWDGRWGTGQPPGPRKRRRRDPAQARDRNGHLPGLRHPQRPGGRFPPHTGTGAPPDQERRHGIRGRHTRDGAAPDLCEVPRTGGGNLCPGLGPDRRIVVVGAEIPDPGHCHRRGRQRPRFHACPGGGIFPQGGGDIVGPLPPPLGPHELRAGRGRLPAVGGQPVLRVPTLHAPGRTAAAALQVSGPAARRRTRVGGLGNRLEAAGGVSEKVPIHGIGSPKPGLRHAGLDPLRQGSVGLFRIQRFQRGPVQRLHTAVAAAPDRQADESRRPGRRPGSHCKLEAKGKLGPETGGRQGLPLVACRV